MILYYSQTHLRIPSVGELFQYLIKLHYSQTLVTSKGTMDKVSVPYEITLLSNECMKLWKNSLVSVPYEITLLSNIPQGMKVIYNVSVPYEITLLSNSLIVCFFVLKFQYLMKLHYSQTEYSVVPNKGTVSVPYEITLLSNGFCRNFCLRWVSVPYEITLLSNQSFYFFLSCFVSVPYEITLLSNFCYGYYGKGYSFSTL